MLTIAVLGGACWGAEIPPLPTPHASGMPAEEAALLRRPLQFPEYEGGCPVTKDSRQVTPAAGPGFGAGPIYPVGNEVAVGRRDDGLYGGKILWIGDKDYEGPALIRGKRLDREEAAHFTIESGGTTDEFLLTAGGWAHATPVDGTSHWPSGVVVRGGGCYAFQIDGTDFTTVVVLKVRA